MHESYRRDGFGPAMAQFIHLLQLDVPLTPDFLDLPSPDPATFGLPADDDGRRDDPLLGLNASVTLFEPDVEALRASPATLLIGVGRMSGGQVAARAGRALAAQLGQQPLEFPGGHTGFVGADNPMAAGDPNAFAPLLRDALDRAAAE